MRLIGFWALKYSSFVILYFFATLSMYEYSKIGLSEVEIGGGGFG
jgi:hypothetical protein